MWWPRGASLQILSVIAPSFAPMSMQFASSRRTLAEHDRKVLVVSAVSAFARALQSALHGPQLRLDTGGAAGSENLTTDRQVQL